MSSEALFQRFMEMSPVTVMLRATLENVFSPQAIDAIFVDAAQEQYEGELLFSSVVDLLALVVWRQKKSVGEAYKHAQEKFEVSVRSVYNKLNGTEMAVCRELVRRPAVQLSAVVDTLHGRPPKLRGYRTRIIDGNKLTSTDHRLKPLRRTRSGPLPGMALAVLDPDRMLIVDLFCCEDGEAQERRIFPEVIPNAKPGELWIADRNFCTTGFLFGLAEQRACFVIRQHASTLSWEKETRQKKVGSCETGPIYEQILHLRRGDDTLLVRRITVKLYQPTESGETEIHLLTNLPRHDADDPKVAELYLTRWTIENAFQEIEQGLRSEINTLGYPGAALLGFAIAVVTYNVLSVAKWAIEREHTEAKREELSGYYLASIVASDYGGMMIALPEKQWTKRFADLSARQMASRLRACAKHVRPDIYRKNIRGPKRPRPKRTSGAVMHHVSTAELLNTQK
ncbi:MAG TPA: transposase [Hyphomicrobiaceae bacterium]|nr:transposase [Hyphomicrobiaceae bacterium]